MKKERISELALLGGASTFVSPLHVGRPNIGNRERFFARLNEMFDRAWFTNNGPFVQQLEKRVASFAGVKHCIAMCNGTIGLEIAIRALGLKGEVIVPSMTFIATAHALQWQEITPVFCDINPVSLCIDPVQVEKLITPKTTGIIGVHLFGNPCNVEALQDIANRHNLKLLYDAAHAFGCSHKGRMVGGFGNAEIFSFHATKLFHTFEGGAILTNDDELAQKIRLMKNFGFAGYDNVIYIGTNGKMSEVSAAMGLTLLESLDEIIATNKRNYHCYLEGLASLPGITVLAYDETEKRNCQYVVLVIDENRLGLSRDELLKVLHAENVLARRYFYPGCHRMEPYRSYFPNAGMVLPQTETFTSRLLSLPTGTAVTEDDIRKICSIIRLVARQSGEIREALARMSR